MSIVAAFDKTLSFNNASRYAVLRLKTADIMIPQESRSPYHFRDHLIRFTAVGYDLPQTGAVSREDSFERLLEQDQQFSSSESETAEEAAIKAILIERLYSALNTLSKDELALIYDLFFLHHTERQFGKKMNISVGTVNKRKKAILRKLRKLVE